MFIDQIELHIRAGKGGDGIVSWMHQKGLDHAGPGGGDGGKGGDVYLKGVSDIAKLSEYRFEKEHHAEDGEPGKADRRHGKNGEDLVLELPMGSVVIDNATGAYTEVLSAEPILFLKGGYGGYGNAYFRSSTNIRPKERTLGKAGQGGIYTIELRLIAHVGLIGLPNAGKSSLLNSLTAASVKVGNYPFTTLHPHLGVLHGFTLADIPGLIEGASLGRGLGDSFLKHISRTSVLAHCISCEEADVRASDDIIRKELGDYDSQLLDKKEIIILTKKDLCSPEELSLKKQTLLETGRTVLDVSILDDESMHTLSSYIVKILKEYNI